MADVIKVGPDGVKITGGIGGLLDAATGLLNRKPEPAPQAPVAADTTIKFNEQGENAATLEAFMKENRLRPKADGKITLAEAKALKDHVDKKLAEISGEVIVTTESITLKAEATNALGLTFKGAAQPAAPAPAPAANTPNAPAPAGAAPPSGEAARLEKLVQEGNFFEKAGAIGKLDYICLAQGKNSEHYDSGVCGRVEADAAKRGNNQRER